MALLVSKRHRSLSPQSPPRRCRGLMPTNVSNSGAFQPMPGRIRGAKRELFWGLWQVEQRCSVAFGGDTVGSAACRPAAPWQLSQPIPATTASAPADETSPAVQPHHVAGDALRIPVLLHRGPGDFPGVFPERPSRRLLLRPYVLEEANHLLVLPPARAEGVALPPPSRERQGGLSPPVAKIWLRAAFQEHPTIAVPPMECLVARKAVRDKQPAKKDPAGEPTPAG
jgi:hypothetical protein